MNIESPLGVYFNINELIISGINNNDFNENKQINKHKPTWLSHQGIYHC